MRTKRSEKIYRQIHRLNVERRKLPFKYTTDKKLVYVRYADDFIIGVSGTREDAMRWFPNIGESMDTLRAAVKVALEEQEDENMTQEKFNE